MSESLFFTKKEFAKQIRSTERTVDTLRKQGKVVSVKIGSKVLFPKDQLYNAFQPAKRREVNNG